MGGGDGQNARGSGRRCRAPAGVWSWSGMRRTYAGGGKAASCAWARTGCMRCFELAVSGPTSNLIDAMTIHVGVPGGALGLAWGVVDLAHLVHVDEGVEGSQVDAGEGAADGEALASKPLGAVVTDTTW